MSKKDKKKSSTTNSFKIIIILLALGLLGSFFYIYKMSDRSKGVIVDLRQKNSLFNEEKELILNNLKKSQLMLDEALKSKNNLSEELLAEKNKVKQLIEEIEKSKSDQQVIAQFKKGASDADSRILALMNQLNNYKAKIDSTNVVLRKERKAIDTLKTANNKLNSKINEAANKLSFYNLLVKTYKLKGSGKELETDKASKTDFIKIMFTVGENSLAKATQKTFYIQIIDAKNNVIGEKKTENIGNTILTYSAVKKINYANKSLLVEFNIPVENLDDGNYFVNVFDKFNLILNSSFSLK